MFRQITFQSISGSKAMDWNFQSVKCFDKLTEQYDGRKSGVKKQNSKNGSKNVSMPVAWREFFWFQIPLPVCFEGGRPDLDKSKLV